MQRAFDKRSDLDATIDRITIRLANRHNPPVSKISIAQWILTPKHPTAPILLALDHQTTHLRATAPDPSSHLPHLPHQPYSLKTSPSPSAASALYHVHSFSGATPPLTIAAEDPQALLIHHSPCQPSGVSFLFLLVWMGYGDGMGGGRECPSMFLLIEWMRNLFCGVEEDCWLSIVAPE